MLLDEYELCCRWVVAKDEAAAHAQAEGRFPGRQLSLKQVRAASAARALKHGGWKSLCTCMRYA